MLYNVGTERNLVAFLLVYQQKQEQKQKLTVGSQEERSFLASSPAGTHGYIPVRYQDLCVFYISFFLLLVKERLVFFFFM
jgi:hypothetical protein